MARAAVLPVAGMKPAALLVGTETMTDALTFNHLWDRLCEAEDAYVAVRNREERVERRYGAGSRNRRVIQAALAADVAAFRCENLRRAICGKPTTCASDIRVIARLAHQNPDNPDAVRALSLAVLAFTA